ncbi:MAG: type II toxin-antitoxin system YafQ family toxin [Synergistaceae bacterium]|jgi:mRNA interferase YafQ|nr:type II toxin-antitoxin system YafQ family toxin [Synergistaceae bacterium]
MRFVTETHAYKRDVQKISGGKYTWALVNDLPDVIRMLVEDATLPTQYHDHALTGNWINHNECHVRPKENGIMKYYETLLLRSG